MKFYNQYETLLSHQSCCSNSLTCFFYAESLTIEEFQLCWHAKSLSQFSLNYRQRYNLHEKINGLFHHLLHLSISLDVALISFLVFMTMSSTSAVISSLKITTKNVKNALKTIWLYLFCHRNSLYMTVAPTFLIKNVSVFDTDTTSTHLFILSIYYWCRSGSGSVVSRISVS